MAMITLSEVKAILQITEATYDTLITTLLPIAQGMFQQIRGIPFFIMESEITNGSPIVDILNKNDWSKISLFDKIETRQDNGSNLRGRIQYIDFDDAQITIDSNSSADDDEAEIIIYPASADYAMSKIIDFMITKENATGYKSETFGTYNYTKFDSVTGLPLDITQLIKQYQSVKY